LSLFNTGVQEGRQPLLNFCPLPRTNLSFSPLGEACPELAERPALSLPKGRLRGIFSVIARAGGNPLNNHSVEKRNPVVWMLGIETPLPVQHISATANCRYAFVLKIENNTCHSGAARPVLDTGARIQKNFKSQLI